MNPFVGFLFCSTDPCLYITSTPKFLFVVHNEKLKVVDNERLNMS